MNTVLILNILFRFGFYYSIIFVLLPFAIFYYVIMSEQRWEIYNCSMVRNLKSFVFRLTNISIPVFICTMYIFWFYIPCSNRQTVNIRCKTKQENGIHHLQFQNYWILQISTPSRDLVLTHFNDEDNVHEVFQNRLFKMKQFNFVIKFSFGITELAKLFFAVHSEHFSIWMYLYHLHINHSIQMLWHLLNAKKMSYDTVKFYRETKKNNCAGKRNKYSTEQKWHNATPSGNGIFRVFIDIGKIVIM